MKKNKLPKLVVLMVLTLITTLFWIMFSVYNSYRSEPNVSVTPQMLEPISPNLDSETIVKIKERL